MSHASRAGAAHAVPAPESVRRPSAGQSKFLHRIIRFYIRNIVNWMRNCTFSPAAWYFPVVRGEYIPTEPGARGFRMNDFFEKPYGGSAVGGGGVRVGRQCVAAAVRQEAAAPAPGVGVAPCAFPFRTTCAFSGTETSGSRFVVLIFWLLLLVGQVNAFTSC